MTPDSDTPSVTQADREAAAANIKRRLVWQHGGEQPWMDASTTSMRLGEQDDHDEVQAFARHRLSTTPAQFTSAPGVEGLAYLESEARRFAEMYAEASDGRNTFVIFADKIADFADAAQGKGVELCKWCNDGCGWYTSYTGGFAQWRPCDYCNTDGTKKPDPTRIDLERPYYARLHSIQHESKPLVTPRGGGALVEWAADEIEALRAALSVPTAPAQSEDRVKALEEGERVRKAAEMLLWSHERSQIPVTDAKEAWAELRAALAPVHTPDTAQGVPTASVEPDGVTREAEIDAAVRQAISEGLDAGRTCSPHGEKVDEIFSRIVAVRDEYIAHFSSAITQGREA